MEQRRERDRGYPSPALSPLPWPSLYKLKPQTRPLVIKRLTPTKLRERREKGLCFNCNKKFGSGHRCKRLFYLEGVWEEDKQMEQDHEVEEYTEETAEVSLHAICGIGTTKTMRVHGSIYGEGLTLLVDSGSTHNFLSNKWATKHGIQEADN